MADSVFTVDVDSTTASANLNTLDGGFKKVTDSGDKAASSIDKLSETTKGAGKSFSMLEDSLKNVGKPLEFALSGLNQLKFVALGAAEGFIRLSDEITKFQAFLSMMSVTVGTVGAARQEFQYLLDVANKLGVPVDALTKNLGQFQAAVKGSAIEGDKAKYVFESFATMTRALHLTTHDTTLVFYALTQMMSKGVVSMEELRRQLGEKMPGAMNLAARAVNTTMIELEGAIRKGTVDSGKLLYAMSQQIMREYSIPATIASQALDAQMNRVHNTMKSMIVTMYDLGVASSFSNVLKELNRIISDPAVAKVFAEILKSLADNLTVFLEQIDANFIRTTMNAFKDGIKIGAEVLMNLLNVVKDLLPYFAELVRLALIMKGIELGASVGAAAGAAIGAVATPEFMGLGAIPGAAIGGAVLGISGGITAYGLTKDLGKVKPREPGTWGGASGSWDANEIGGPVDNLPATLRNKMTQDDLYSVNGQIKAAQFYNDLGRSSTDKKLQEANYAAASKIQVEMNKTLGKYDPQTYGQTTSLKDVLNNGGKADNSPAAQFMNQLDRMVETAKANDPLAGLETKLEQLRVSDPKNMTDSRYGKALAQIDQLRTDKQNDFVGSMSSDLEKTLLGMTTPKTETQALEEGLREKISKAGLPAALMEKFRPLLEKIGLASEANFSTKMGSKIESSLDKIKELTAQYSLQYDMLGKSADEQARATTMLSIQKQITADALSLRKDYESQHMKPDDINAAIEAFKRRANAEADAAIGALARVQAYQKSMLGGALKAFSNYADGVADIGATTEQVMTRAFKGMEDALVSFVTTGKLSFRSLADSIIADMARMAVQQSITGPLFKYLGSFLSASTGAPAPTPQNTIDFMGPSAKGNAYSGTGLSAFANTIVSSPTLFPFAKGGSFGLMGEAGAEAIMPLSRDSSGVLGVKAQVKKEADSNNHPEVVVNIINKGEPMKAKQEGSPTMDSFGRMVITVIADAMDSNPGFRSMMGNR